MEVTLLDTFGDDLTVVNAARVSFAKESSRMTTGDEKLIHYLAAHNHVTPFFHPQVRFRLKMPIFLAREWYRHQIGFARNEVSRRYVDSDPEMWTPSLLRQKDANKKQGSSSNTVATNQEGLQLIEGLHKNSFETYKALLGMGVCPEQARIVLPQSMMTEFIETGSLAAYARLCKLRTDPSAQLEIQQLAERVSSLLCKRFPVSWKALFSQNDNEA